MAFSDRVRSASYVASGTLETSQYHIVSVIGEHKVANSLIRTGFGVVQNKPKDGQHATVAVEGATKVTAGGAISVGDLITSAGSGFAAAVGSGTAGDKQVIGRALTDTASGSVFTMEIDRFMIVRTGGLPA